MKFHIMPSRRARQGTATRFSPADVPALIKEIRAVRGLTQEALAREMGVTFSTVNSWENGKHRPIPSLVTRLVDIATEAGLAVMPPERSARRSGPTQQSTGR
jgi:transcriptional regulator with XRE-family HTH domain